MHRSRFSTLLIDVPAADMPAASSFWSAALGQPARPVPDEAEFTHLHGEAVPGLSMALQSIDGSPRYHVDIETDDLDAETARLLALGAVEVGRWLQARTLRAPGGHLLCVIPQHSDDNTFTRYAQVWPLPTPRQRPSRRRSRPPSARPAAQSVRLDTVNVGRGRLRSSRRREHSPWRTFDASTTSASRSPTSMP